MIKMALRDQPYLPLYVQDFLTDERLIECSASATGVYIRLMCIMHKSEEYGVILLKQKDKQTDNQIKNFALKLAKYFPYKFDEIFSALSELIHEGVINVEDDRLTQKRMVKDNYISIERSKSGSKGGKKTQFAKAKTKANVKAKSEANTEYEIEYENELVFSVFKGWLTYKKERGEKYKTQSSAQTAYNNLVKLSGNNPEKAKLIIDQSIGNNWAGMFELKSNGKTNGSASAFSGRENLPETMKGVVL
jgi:uncharacterized protein YdaU (DUF1376 family)